MALAADLHAGKGGGKDIGRRLFVTIWLVGVVFLALAIRLYMLQIIRGEELTIRGVRNFVQDVRVVHDRGIIYDRFGRILADNRPSLDLQVTPAFLGDRAEQRETLRTLAELVEIDFDELELITAEVEGQRGLDRFLPIMVKRDLSRDQVEAIESRRSVFELDGVNIVEGRRRFYPNGSLAAHLLGYVREIDAGQLDAARRKGNPRRYVLGDIIGRDGVERTHEADLRGVDGFEKVVVDAKGRRQHGELIEQLLADNRRIEPQPGKNVFLTIDADLQRRAEEAFHEHGRAGAVVALDPNTGRVLAFVSVPAFDPNLVSGLLGPEEKVRLDEDPLKPWINRAISGQYAPGSTYKVVTGLAALLEEATTPRERVSCPGSFRLGRGVWRCHSTHGAVDLRTALKVSCDTYFYTMGNRVGIDAMAHAARLLGFGRRTGIALRGEQPGLVPDEAFHDRVDKKTGGYQKGMAINTAIGQGSVLVTPLQLALAYAAIANRGTLFEPRIVDRIETADLRVTRRFLPRAADVEELDERQAESGALAPREEVRGEPPQIVERVEPQPASSASIPDEPLEFLREGLFAVTNEPGGTAYWRRSRKVTMAGKTGTAQVVRLGRVRERAENMEYFTRDHAWFASYAPAESPEIVVAVLNEHSGHGGSKAGPVAVAVIDAYFELRERRLAQTSAANSSPAAEAAQ